MVTKLLKQTEGLTPGLQRRVVPVRGAIVPRRELKYADLAAATYATDTTGSVTLLNGIAEGDDNSANRTGRQAMMRSVGLCGYLLTSLAATTPQKVRLLLVWDNATNGAAPTVANILSAATSLCFHNVDNESRFTVLWDHTAVLGPQVSTATQAIADQTVKDVNVVVPLSSVTQYIGTGATIAAVSNGGLFLVTIGTAAPGGTASTFQGAARIRYTDED